MDALSDLLASIRARSASWALLDAKAPWGIAFPRRPSTICIHHVVSGAAEVAVGGAKPSVSGAEVATEGPALALLAGDLAVVPHGRAHSLQDRAGTPAVALGDLPQSGASDDHAPFPKAGTSNDRAPHLRLGGKGPETRILSAWIDLDDPFSAPIVSSLPPVFRLTGAGESQALLVEHLRLLVREIELRPMGSDLVLARVADVVFVQVLRAYVETLSDAPPHACRSLELVSAMRDPSVAKALGVMSRQPEYPWTVASLAEHVGLSRSAFAARFTSLVGEPPLGFLTRLRMKKATSLLREGATLALTSQLTGYGSEASFSHAFRQWSGMAPGAYRRQQRGQTEVG